MMKILLQSQSLAFAVEFDDSPIAREIAGKLPLDSQVSKWGDEIYFSVAVAVPEAEATTDVNVGDVAYWPEGGCVCIFFGKTPQSTSERPVPASPVVIIGKTIALPEELRRIQDNEKITVSRDDGEKNPSSSCESERKLSQSEIDDLVKRLLAERNKSG